MIWFLIIKAMTVDANDVTHFTEVRAPVAYSSVTACQKAADAFNNGPRPSDQLAGCELAHRVPR